MNVPVLPESAPFSPTQRAWLNGFFAGLLSGGGGVASSTSTPAPPVEEESFPWHEPSLTLDQRMKLAEGKPLDRVLMAAMAQLDCGSCGYVCRTYAEAIANGTDKDLTKCSPGGKETAKMLRAIMKGEVAVANPRVEVKVKGNAIESNGHTGVAGTTPKPYGRSNPFPAALIESRPLNAPGSAKDIRHVVLDLTGSNLKYSVGDSLGVYPENCVETVNRVIAALKADGSEPVGVGQGRSATLFDALFRHFSITRPGDSLIELLCDVATDAAEKEKLKTFLDDGPPDGYEVLDLLEEFPSARPNLDLFVAALSPVQPRLYSISSSQLFVGDQVHLTVGVVRYTNPRGRACKGVASTFLAERLPRGRRLKIFINPSHGFGLPADPNVPIIMIGPGTGVAPFRAFLQERRATQARGRNWLFFGDQRSETDFIYRDEFERDLKDGLLSRLDLAWSRDQDAKIYVQHRMLENAAAIWSWINDGAHLYVCGDASRMARDVDAALVRIVAEQGGMSDEDASAFLKTLTHERRYQRDVY